MKPILVSGIQPSGQIHLGNYLGALKNFVDLQNSGKYQCYFFVVDLHSLTEIHDPFSQTRKQHRIRELTADFLAAGIDPKKSIFAQQSQIPQHTELTWIFSTLTPIGELGRMTQFKEKSDKHGENVGLFTYPILMAADILIYNPKIVPVGEDQVQHIELTRTIARKFNQRFGQTFIEPQVLLTKAARIMSLGDPRRKMSKSIPETCLFIYDSPEDIIRKLKRAVTDSENEVRYDKEKKPAISNLLTIYEALSGKSMSAIEKHFAGKGYGQFKMELAHLIADYFADYRKKKSALMKKPKFLSATLKTGSLKAAKIAEKKLLEVKKKIGLVV